MIRIGAAQQAAIDEACKEGFHDRLVSWLREQLPEVTAALDDDQLKERIQAAEEEGAEYGIETERAIAKWTYLILVTSGKMSSLPGLREYMAAPEPSPSEKVDQLMQWLAMMQEGGGHVGP